MADLVTGATGFTGGHLARYLVAQGRRVRALVRDRRRAAQLEHDGVELVVEALQRAAAPLEGRKVVNEVNATQPALLVDATLFETALANVDSSAYAAACEGISRPACGSTCRPSSLSQ